MKKKLSLIIAILICSASLLTSCGTKEIDFSKIIEKDSFEEELPTPSTAVKIADKGSLTSATDTLALFTDYSDTGEKTLFVYNLISEKKVGSFTNHILNAHTYDSTFSYQIYLEELLDTSWFVVEKTSSTQLGVSRTSALYNSDGELLNEITVPNQEYKSYSIIADLLKFGNKIYHVSDGSIAEYLTISDFKEIPGGLEKAGNNYVSESNSVVTVYDKELEIVSVLRIPSYGQGFSCIPLSNGDVLVQYTSSNGDYTDEYSFIYNGTKYQLHSTLINGKNGSHKDLDLDFVVESSVSVADMEANGAAGAKHYNDKIDNIAYVSLIEDGKVDPSNLMLVSLSDNLKIKANITADIPGMLSSTTQISNNRWLIQNDSNQRFLANEKGEVLGELSLNAAKYNSNFIVSNNKIFNHDLELLADLTTEKAVSLTLMNNSVVFVTVDGETKLWADGEIKTLISKNENNKIFTLANDYSFVIYNIENKTDFKVYNDQGEVIYTPDGTVHFHGVPYEKPSSDKVITFATAGDPVGSSYITLLLK